MATDLPQPPIQPNIPGEGVHRVTDVLPGLAKTQVIRAIAADYPITDLLEQARLLCFRGDGYPRVDDHTGHILCPSDYPAAHEPMIVYLDVLHELVHVRQVLEGKPVYHFPEPYVTWPTEIEAYRITYEEAQRLDLDDGWFWHYLAVPWVPDDELSQLADAIGLPVPTEVDVDHDHGDEEGVRH